MKGPKTFPMHSDSKLAYRSFVDSGRRGEISGSETKDLLIQCSRLLTLRVCVGQGNSSLLGEWKAERERLATTEITDPQGPAPKDTYPTSHNSATGWKPDIHNMTLWAPCQTATVAQPHCVDAGWKY